MSLSSRLSWPTTWVARSMSRCSSTLSEPGETRCPTLRLTTSSSSSTLMGTHGQDQGSCWSLCRCQGGGEEGRDALPLRAPQEALDQRGDGCDSEEERPVIASGSFHGASTAG